MKKSSGKIFVITRLFTILLVLLFAGCGGGGAGGDTPAPGNNTIAGGGEGITTGPSPQPGNMISGSGLNCPFPANLSLDVDSESPETSWLVYSFQEMLLVSMGMSITNIDVISGTATVTGNGFVVNEAGEYIFTTFTATIIDGIDGSPDKMGIEIPGVTYSVSPEDLIYGSGYTIVGAEALAVSGSGFNCPFPASLSLNVDSESLATSWLVYHFKDMLLTSTSITSVSVNDDTATVEGTGEVVVNEAGGDYTFTATFTAIIIDGIDGSPDKMGIEIKDSAGETYYSVGPEELIDGIGYTID